jgi:hypothetical protein
LIIGCHHYLGGKYKKGNQAKVLCERKSCRFLTQEGAIAVCEWEIEGEYVIGWYTETQRDTRSRAHSERERERERGAHAHLHKECIK